MYDKLKDNYSTGVRFPKQLRCDAPFIVLFAIQQY